MAPGGPRRLGGAREVDEAVGIVDRGAEERTVALGIPPHLLFANLVDRGHAPPSGEDRDAAVRGPRRWLLRAIPVERPPSLIRSRLDLPPSRSPIFRGFDPDGVGEPER